MKNLIIYIVILLMLAPQVSHSDVVVHDNLTSHLCNEMTRNDFHHDSDSDDDKKTEHHHHCNINLQMNTLCLPNALSFEIKPIVVSKYNIITHYKAFHTNPFVGKIFHPPKQLS